MTLSNRHSSQHLYERWRHQIRAVNQRRSLKREAFILISVAEFFRRTGRAHRSDIPLRDRATFPLP